jgi:hypothetical protein
MPFCGSEGAMLVAEFTMTVIVVLLFAYVFAARPWHQQWGASHLDRVSKLPGDDLSPRAPSFVTHAINIHAPPESVWPWLVQIGQDRGGFYSYSFLENLIGLGIHNTRRIVPEWQNRAEGDTVWFASPKRFGGGLRMIAAVVRPPEALVLVTADDWPRVKVGDEALGPTWAFFLKPVSGNKTRLTTRLRAESFPGLGTKMANFFFWEPAHFVMERRMLLTIKGLAEKYAATPEAKRAQS